MTIIEQIKAEIERLKKAQEVSEDKDYAQYELDVACGYDMACDDILSFLSTLESEKPIIPNDLEEAAKDILTGILSNPIQMIVGDKPIKTINDYLTISIELTDELIKRLKEK